MLLCRFYAELSPDSRAEPVPRSDAAIADGIARAFCGPDHRHREGIVAVAVGDDGRSTIIGHVCIEPITVDEAEMAIAVADAWQRRGVGRAMLEEAIRWARAHGMARLRAFVRWASNGAVMALMRVLGCPLAYGPSTVAVVDVSSSCGLAPADRCAPPEARARTNPAGAPPRARLSLSAPSAPPITVVLACVATCSETLPWRNRAAAFRPRVPTTIVSKWPDSATRSMAWAGSPTRLDESRRRRRGSRAPSRASASCCVVDGAGRPTGSKGARPGWTGTTLTTAREASNRLARSMPSFQRSAGPARPRHRRRGSASW